MTLWWFRLFLYLSEAIFQIFIFPIPCSTTVRNDEWMRFYSFWASVNAFPFGFLWGTMREAPWYPLSRYSGIEERSHTNFPIHRLVMSFSTTCFWNSFNSYLAPFGFLFDLHHCYLMFDGMFFLFSAILFPLFPFGMIHRLFHSIKKQIGNFVCFRILSNISTVIPLNIRKAWAFFFTL